MPKNGTDMSAWAVVACDQFTSEAEYWEKLKEYVGGRPSALELILPEIYLSQRGAEEKVAAAMRRYLKDGVFKKTEKGLILTVRSTPYVGRRIGLVGAVDLEEYDYSPNSSALIRATEATIEERIPPRMKIRKNAPAEFSHIMLLYDDASRSLNEKLYERRAEFEKIYDFDLNMDGGHVEGYFICDCEGILSAFAQLGSAAGDFLFAAGDGNHSLATAKEHWNELKKDLSDEKRNTHPARYCLAEIVNLYDDGIYFEPIYRYVSGVDKAAFADRIFRTDGNFILYDGKALKGKKNAKGLPESIAEVDAAVKEYIAAHGGKVDYVHGLEHLKSLVESNSDSVGILFDALEKKDLFSWVAKNGSLPRKTFSMGEGVEKRYYLEGKLITDGDI